MTDGKSSFSVFLRELMVRANVKNAALSNALQYDVSYISKWLSGRSLPAEKGVDKISAGIAQCIVDMSDTSAVEAFYAEYGCSERKALQQKLCAAIREKYHESRKERTAPDAPERASVTRFYAEIPVQQLAASVNQHLEQAQQAAAVLDLLRLERDARLLLAGIEDGRFSGRGTKGQQYSMVISLHELPGMPSRDHVYDSIYIIHMLTSFSHLDFRLYNHPAAAGMLLWTSDAAYAAAGHLLPGMPGQCIAVSETEDAAQAELLYQRAMLLTSPETLIFRRATMQELIGKNDYILSVLSTEVKWLIGHATELILSQSVFETLAAKQTIYDPARLRKLYYLLQSMFDRRQVCIMFYESAFTQFIVTGEVDFFNVPFTLNVEQRVECLEHIISLIAGQDERQVKLIDGGFSTDFQYITNPCLFMSDVFCYVRLENERYEDDILVLQDKMMRECFSRFYAEIWSRRSDVVIEGEEVDRRLRQFRDSASYLNDVNGRM